MEQSKTNSQHYEFTITDEGLLQFNLTLHNLLPSSTYQTIEDNLVGQTVHESVEPVIDGMFNQLTQILVEKKELLYENGKKLLRNISGLSFKVIGNFPPVVYTREDPQTKRAVRRPDLEITAFEKEVTTAISEIINLKTVQFYENNKPHYSSENQPVVLDIASKSFGASFKKTLAEVDGWGVYQHNTYAFKYQFSVITKTSDQWKKYTPADLFNPAGIVAQLLSETTTHERGRLYVNLLGIENTYDADQFLSKMNAVTSQFEAFTKKLVAGGKLKDSIPHGKDKVELIWLVNDAYASELKAKAAEGAENVKIQGGAEYDRAAHNFNEGSGKSLYVSADEKPTISRVIDTLGSYPMLYVYQRLSESGNPCIVASELFQKDPGFAGIYKDKVARTIAGAALQARGAIYVGMNHDVVAGGAIELLKTLFTGTSAVVRMNAKLLDQLQEIYTLATKYCSIGARANAIKNVNLVVDGVGSAGYIHYYKAHASTVGTFFPLTPGEYGARHPNP